jgi:hypothetical protein
MLPSRVLTAARRREVIHIVPSTTALSRSSVFLCAREGIVTLPLGGRLGTGIVADINPARTDPSGDWSPVAMERPAQAGRLPPGDIVVERVHS